MSRTLPPRVYEKAGTYWHVTAVGIKREWKKLCRVREGLPAMYTALAALLTTDDFDDMMPKLVADWTRDVASRHSAKTQADDTFRSREIAIAFSDFRANQVRPTDVTVFLAQFKAMPRTYNAYRSAMREFMRYAEEHGHRPAGSNPVDSLRTMKVRARSRYITDSELRRIKVAAMYGKDGLKTRSGPVICALIDMAYLTGQRIGDLLTLEWSAIGREGINFAPAKLTGSTGVRVLIQWTPRLRELVERIKKFKRQNIKIVFTTQEAQAYSYWGASTAWKRAVKRSEIKGVHFHDLRAKALTDVDRLRGIGESQSMGGHSTQAQTADYIRHKTAKKTGATR